jgi:hypothetical protein
MKILKVFGDDDYAALQFDDKYEIAKVFEMMIESELTEMTLYSIDGQEIYVKILEFNTPEELFEYYKSVMQDYDDSKHINYYRV